MLVLSQNDVLLNSLKQYFSNNTKEYQTFLDIVNKKSEISLRILDFFVTTYAKQKKLILPENQYTVHQEYKNQLRGYSKKKFDPFSRTYKNSAPRKFLFEHPEGNIETTIGQLNFFRWALSNGIVEYLNNHYDDVFPLLSKNTKNTAKKTRNKESEEELHITARKEDGSIVVSGLI